LLLSIHPICYDVMLGCYAWVRQNMIVMCPLIFERWLYGLPPTSTVYLTGIFIDFI